MTHAHILTPHPTRKHGRPPRLFLACGCEATRTMSEGGKVYYHIIPHKPIQFTRHVLLLEPKRWSALQKTGRAQEIIREALAEKGY